MTFWRTSRPSTRVTRSGGRLQRRRQVRNIRGLQPGVFEHRFEPYSRARVSSGSSDSWRPVSASRSRPATRPAAARSASTRSKNGSGAAAKRRSRTSSRGMPSESGCAWWKSRTRRSTPSRQPRGAAWDRTTCLPRRRQDRSTEDGRRARHARRRDSCAYGQLCGRVTARGYPVPRRAVRIAHRLPSGRCPGTQPRESRRRTGVPDAAPRRVRIEDSPTADGERR